MVLSYQWSYSLTSASVQLSVLCPAGTFAVNNATEICTSCGNDEFAPIGSTECSTCPDGTEPAEPASECIEVIVYGEPFPVAIVAASVGIAVVVLVITLFACYRKRTGSTQKK